MQKKNWKNKNPDSPSFPTEISMKFRKSVVVIAKVNRIPSPPLSEWQPGMKKKILGEGQRLSAEDVSFIWNDNDAPSPLRIYGLCLISFSDLFSFQGNTVFRWRHDLFSYLWSDMIKIFKY